MRSMFVIAAATSSGVGEAPDEPGQSNVSAGALPTLLNQSRASRHVAHQGRRTSMTKHIRTADRRVFLQSTATAGATLLSGVNVAAASRKMKTVAAIVTIYRKNSHSDVIVGKILGGWKQDGGHGPALRLASLYVDQFPKDDMARGLAEKHGFPIYRSIEQAITLGTGQVAVDGVLSIGEHGNYPWNAKGQHLYPRRRFFEKITDTFERHGKVVPIFNDKHPGPQWDDALWMYNRALELKVPWMAGSSLPISFRDPDVTLPMGSRVEACLGVGYSGLDVYGFHTLDFLQCFMERRRDAEMGVRWVRCLPADSLAGLINDGTIQGDLLDAALACSKTDRPSALQSVNKDSAVFLIQYRDGLLVPVLMLPAAARAISVACKTQDGEVLATRAEERVEPRYPHFANLLKGIEQMIHTGKPAYPVERSMLSAGTLDRLLTSRQEQGKRMETPELRIRYQPVDYGFAPHIDLSKVW